MTDIRFIAKGAGYCFAAWRQAYVLDWRGVPSFESLDAAVSGKASVLRDYPNGVVVLNILRADTQLPSASVRKYAEKKQSEDLEGVLCHATVVDAEGFWAGAMRSMLAGLYLVGRSPFPRKVFATLSEAAYWQSSIANEHESWAHEFIAAVERIRASG